MGRGYTAAGLDWCFRPTGLVTTGLLVQQITYGMDIYSRYANFLGHARFYGSGLGAGLDLSSAELIDDWIELPPGAPFRAADLHGAKGALKFYSVGAGVGTNVIRANASFKGTPLNMFEGEVGSISAGLGIALGCCWGQWRITAVWIDGGPPVGETSS